MLINIQNMKNCYIASPVNPVIAAAFLKDMIAGGAPPKSKPELFMQSWEDLENTLDGYIPLRKMKELDEGYSVTIRIPDWDFRHMLGYCRF